MKKLWVKILCLILSVACLGSVVSACNLVSTDGEKSSKLVIAKIKIDDEEDDKLNVESKSIYKKDLYSGYLSYGYYYVNYYGYSTSKTFQTILDNLVNNAVVEQFARRRLTQFYSSVKNKAESERTDFEKYFYENLLATTTNQELVAKSDIDLFLTAYQKAEAEFELKDAIASIIEQYSDSEDDETKTTESVTLDERANPYEEEERDFTEEEMKIETPTDNEYKAVLVKLGKDCSEENLAEIKANYTNLYDLNMYKFAEFDYDVSSRANRKALNKGLENLRSYYVIPSNENYKSEEVEKYTYFKEMLYTEKVQAMVNTFENYLEKDVESRMTDDMLYSAYESLYNTQKDKYDASVSDYETDLTSADEDTFIVYNPYNNYGYVSNLLIGFSDWQEESLKTYKAKKGITTAEVESFRNELANTIVAQDQRAYWVVNGYGSYDGTDFVFGDKYLCSSNSAVKKYLGSVSNPVSTTEKNSDDVEETKWTCDSATPNSISFTAFADTYLKPIGITDIKFFNNDASVQTLTYDEAFKNAFEDLLYAFSTDPGCLGKLYGYLYSPKNNQYVEEFNKCAKALVENGVGSYGLVVTDYGIHIMVCTKVVERNIEKIEKSDFSSWAEYDAFKESKIDSLVSNQVQKELNNFISNYLGDDTTAVKYYKKNYSDLITD